MKGKKKKHTLVFWKNAFLAAFLDEKPASFKCFISTKAVAENIMLW